MRRTTQESTRPHSLCQSVDIAVETTEVFMHWIRFERFPEFMRSVRRAKRISDRRVLWDVVIAGHQLVWEAHIVALAPDACIRWESRWGTRMTGEVRFERLGRQRTRVTVEIEYLPDGLVERIGASLGWVDSCVRREIAAFREHVQSQARVNPIGSRSASDRDRRHAHHRQGALRSIQAGRSSGERPEPSNPGSDAPSSREDDKTADGSSCPSAQRVCPSAQRI